MKTGIKAIVFVALILLVVGASFAASTNPPFAATCQDVLAHGYRDGTDLFGKPIGESWTTDENFHMTWKFIYEGGEHITIDDKQAYVVSQHSGVFIAIEGSTNGFASGVWAYAIHLGMQRIVASQVNAAGSLDNSRLQEVKARSVNLKCTFVFDTAQPPSIASNRQDIVKQAQTRLKALGFDPGPVDGMLGLRTREALRWFQLANGLPTDGALDEATRRALGIE